MSMTVNCPSCNKSLRIGEENQGKKMRCPSCQQVFKAPMADEVGGEDEAPSPPPRRDSEDDRPPARERDEDRPSRRGREDRDDYTDRPSRRGRDDYEEDRPSRRPARDDDYDDRPSRRRPRRDDDYDVRGGGRREDVPNYLVPAILVTLFCCLFGGVAAIIYASQANSKAQAGDYRGAMEAANTAKIWMWVSFGIGLAGNLAYFLLMAAGAAAN